MHIYVYVLVLEGCVLVIDEADKALLEVVFSYMYTRIYIRIYMYTCI